MKINTKLILFFLLISLFPLSIVSIISYWNTKKAIRGEVLNHLESVAVIQKNRVESTINHNLERLSLVASRTQLRLSLKDFIENPKKEYQEMINRILIDARSSIRDFVNLSVLTLDGGVVASTDRGKIGTIYFDEEFFIRGKRKNIMDIFFDNEDRRMFVRLVGPLHLEDELLGVLLIESSPEDFVSLVNNYSGLGKTGETLLVKKTEDSNILILTPLRFGKPRMTLSERAMDDPAVQAVMKKEQTSIEASDYRGKPVLAITKYIEITDWGLVVKIDKAEALAPITWLQNLLIYVILASLIVVVLTAFYSARSITRPIFNLIQVVSKIREGDLSQKVKVTSKDEVGILTLAFNRMTENLTHEITTRRLSEEELRKNEEKYRSIFETAASMIILVDKAGIILDCNNPVQEMLGYFPGEIIGGSIDKIVHPDCRDRAHDCLNELFNKGSSKNKDYRMIGKDGVMVDVIVNSSGLKNRSGEYISALCIIEDMRERRHLEEQLLMAQKMEAIGRLAGGIAHDFNNVITAIIGYSDFLLMTHKPEGPVGSCINEIKKAGERAASLTNQLLAFSRKQILQPQVLNLNKLIEEMEKMIRRIIGEDIDLVTRLDPELGHTKADPGQIEQVIMNLVVNARDAVPKGGRLTIETESVYLDEEYMNHHISVKTGPYIMLAVSDNGVGMDEGTRSRIFEPFFTTKEKGKGTGLGLSTVYGIVKQSGGNIWVYSEPGFGTTFKIYLPKVDEEIESVKIGQAPIESFSGTETVLIVEDDDIVRDLVQRTLIYYNYEVLVARNPNEALSFCKLYEGKIHLMITDVVMPEMSGRELAERLESLYPEIKVLYISGYTDEVIVQYGMVDKDIAFLQKPFTPINLLNKIREVLNSPSNKQG